MAKRYQKGMELSPWVDTYVLLSGLPHWLCIAAARNPLVRLYSLSNPCLQLEPEMKSSAIIALQEMSLPWTSEFITYCQSMVSGRFLVRSCSV